MNTRQYTIRRAEAADAEALASLAGQLGYPTCSSDVRKHLSALSEHQGHSVFVAEKTDGCIVGWIHLMPRRLLYIQSRAEIGGLVVDAKHRRTGVGRKLIEAGEDWAKAHGYSSIIVRSNAARTESHAFYPRLGYQDVKTQRVYVKELDDQQHAAQVSSETAPRASPDEPSS